MKDPVELLVDLSIEDAVAVIGSALVIAAESFATQQNKVVLEAIRIYGAGLGPVAGIRNKTNWDKSVMKEFISVYSLFFDKTENITAHDLLNISEPIKYAPQIVNPSEVSERGVKIAEHFLHQPIEQVIDGLIGCWVRWIKMLDDQTVQQFIIKRKQVRWTPAECRLGIIGYWQEYYTF